MLPQSSNQTIGINAKMCSRYINAGGFRCQGYRHEVIYDNRTAYFRRAFPGSPDEGLSLLVGFVCLFAFVSSLLLSAFILSSFPLSLIIAAAMIGVGFMIIVWNHCSPKTGLAAHVDKISEAIFSYHYSHGYYEERIEDMRKTMIWDEHQEDPELNIRPQLEDLITSLKQANIDHPEHIEKLHQLVAAFKHCMRMMRDCRSFAPIEPNPLFEDMINKFNKLSILYQYERFLHSTSTLYWRVMMVMSRDNCFLMIKTELKKKLLIDIERDPSVYPKLIKTLQEFYYRDNTWYTTTIPQLRFNMFSSFRKQNPLETLQYIYQELPERARTQRLDKK